MGSHRKTLVAAAVPVGFLLSGALIWQASYAAFTSTTQTNNTWTAGTVTLTDDDTGNVLINATNLVPGAAVSRCIVVQYQGDVAANVAMTAALTDGGLAPYLNLAMDWVPGDYGTSGSCDAGYVGAGPTAITMTGSGTTAATAGSLANSYAVAASPATNLFRTYRVTYSVQSNDLAQGKSASVGLTWTATSS